MNFGSIRTRRALAGISLLAAAALAGTALLADEGGAQRQAEATATERTVPEREVSRACEIPDGYDEGTGALYDIETDNGVAGLSVHDAIAQLEAKGFIVRVLCVDGSYLPHTDDFSDGRMNLYVDDGVVKAAVSG